MDLPDAEDNLELFKEEVGKDVEIIPISAYTKENIDQLLYAIADKLDEYKDVDFTKRRYDESTWC